MGENSKHAYATTAWAVWQMLSANRIGKGV
jgi:hypothetical protein